MRFLILLLLAAPPALSAAPAVAVTVRAVPPFVPAIWNNTIVVQAGLSQQFAATVLGDAANSGVTWSVEPCGEPNCGTIDATGKYTAPTTPPGFGSDWWTNMTIVARSVADPTKTGSIFVVVTPVPTAIAVTPSNVTVQIKGVQQFALTGSPMGTFPSVTWSVSGAGCAGPDCGTVDSTGKYTAPAAAPNPPIVTVTAASSVDASMTGSAAVNLGANPNNAKLAGHYAFLTSGLDYEGVFNFAGSFVADGTGKITDGKWDSISTSDAGLGQNVSFTGTYSVGLDGRGAMSIRGPNNRPELTFSFALGSFSEGVANRGRISEVEPGNPDLGTYIGGGVLARQDPSAFSTAAITGGYAFAFSTPTQGCRDLFANGRFTASKGALTAGKSDVVSIANGAFCNVPSAYSSNLSFTGTYSVNPNGRGTAAFTFASQSPVFIHFAFYVVSASELFFVETDPWGPIPDLAHERSPLGGVALQQSTGQFSASSLTGPEVLTVTDDKAQNNLGVSLAAFDGIGTLTGTTDVVDNAGSVVSTVPVNGTYTVDPDGLGRGVLTFSGDLSPKPFYLISPGKGLILDTTIPQSGVVRIGALEPQFGGPFENSSLSGTYVLDVSPAYLSPLGSPGAGLLLADGARNLSGIVDSPDGTGSGLGVTFTATYSIDANGRGTLTTTPNAGPPLNWILYVADPSKIFLRQAIWGGGHATIETPVTLAQRATFSMADRGGVSWRSSGTAAANVVAGYASIRPDSGTTPAGLAILGFRQNNVLVTEASVPASPLIQSGRIYAEMIDPVNTGLAIANPNSQPASVSFFFTDSNGNFGNGNTTIPANKQISKFLDQAPFNGRSSWSGTFTFSSSVPVAVMALRGRTNERGEFLITTLPVADLDAPAETGTTLFPHFVDGGGWTTKIVLVNPSDSVLSGTVQFVDPLGRFASAALNGQFIFSYSIAARSSQTFQTGGGGIGVLSGSARVVPATNTRTPSGLAIFAFRHGGITVTEAGVPTIAAGTAFRLYAEIDGPIQTGIAVVNNSTNAAAVTLELSKLDGTSAGPAGTLSIPPNGQTAVFLSEVPGFGSLPTPFQGVLRVSSPVSISVIGLRGHYNERNDFLISTTPPVNEAALPATPPLFFPYIADSGGYTTQFILFSAQPGSSSSGTMQLFNQSGGALGLTLH